MDTPSVIGGVFASGSSPESHKLALAGLLGTFHLKCRAPITAWRRPRISMREVGVSHAAPRRHFPDRQALLDALAEDGFERLGDELRGAVEQAGTAFDDRLHAVAQAYIAFATRHPALLELMFAGKQRAGADRVRETADRAFAVPVAAIADAQAAGELVPGDPGRVVLAVFATLQGLAAIANGGMIEAMPVDTAVTEAIDQLLDGLRPR